MKIGILGTGAYGLALGNIIIDNNHELVMWTKFKEEKELLDTTRCNERAIKNFKIPEQIIFTNDLKEAVNDKDLIIIAIPAAYILELVDNLKPMIKDNNILIATKGIENETGKFINEILEEKLNTKNIAVISGPSFAKDLVERMPAGLSLGSNNEELITIVKKALCNKYIKLRETKDIIGVEACGAIKNVIALAAGMLSGLGANESTKAMLITEAIHDMKEMLKAFDADSKTISSFAGIGDLLLTCNSESSRNFSFGKLIGEQKSEKEIEQYLNTTTVEGMYTLKSIYKLLRNKKINIEVIDLVYNIMVRKEKPESLLTFLVEKD